MAKRTDYTVKEKKPLFGKNNKSGKDYKKGTSVTYTDGGKQTFLTPSGKGAKYAAELKNNTRYTNDGQVKYDEDGRKFGLSKAQRSFRAGYLSAQKDSAKAYNAREQKKAAKAEARAVKKAEKQAKKSGTAWGSGRGQFMGIETNFKAERGAKK
jgi:hypothetical protein